MDSGASFSEPKISMEPLKAVQVRGKRVKDARCFVPSFRTVTPPAMSDRNLSGLSRRLANTNGPALLADESISPCSRGRGAENLQACSIIWRRRRRE